MCDPNNLASVKNDSNFRSEAKSSERLDEVIFISFCIAWISSEHETKKHFLLDVDKSAGFSRKINSE